MATVAATLLVATCQALAAPRRVLPLRSGTTWRYVGHADYTDSSGVRTCRVAWTTRVVRSFHSRATSAAVISGFPFDLAWYEPGKEPKLAVLVESQTGIFHQGVETLAEGEATALKAIAGEVVGEQILAFPVEVGACLSDPDYSRDDGFYCWAVESEAQTPRGDGWTISYRSMPDHQILDLVPGVGITSYVYGHHGTTAITDVRLTRFHPSANNAKRQRRR